MASAHNAPALPSHVLRVLLLSSGVLLSTLFGLSQAQITLDGSLGPLGALRGPNYLISDRVGQIRGPNLFHSFGQFNLSTGEIAIFTGPSTIHNILGRVTGGSPSMIDGLISTSSIPGANLYLLNPSGVMFGPNASLDVSGSFHVSTADYLRLADGACFSAHRSDTSGLTVAAPAAFGFLGPTPAPMSVSGSTLEVPEGQTLSFIGGDITVAPFHSLSPKLMAPGGRITLVSVASAGEVGFHPTEPLRPPELNAFTSLGRVTLSGDARLDASGTSGGTITSGGIIVIRGGHLMIDFSTVTSVTRGDVDGAETGIDIGVAGDAVITNQTAVGTATRGAGHAGAVRLTAGSVEVSNGASLSTRTFPGSTGLGGDMNIEVSQLTLTGAGRIQSLTQGAKQAGTVTVTAHDMIRIAGQGSNSSSLATETESTGAGGLLKVAAPTISVDGGLISTSTSGVGRGSDIKLKVGQLSLTSGGSITTNTFGEGRGGTVAITATDTVAIAGRDSMGISSGVQSRGEGDGAAGHLSLAAPTISVDNRGAIFASTTGTGQPGDIQVQVERLSLTGGGGIGSPPLGSGRGGAVAITATDTIALAGQDSTGNPSNILAATSSTGAAGRVRLTAPTISLDGGLISVSTIGLGAGRAGDIQVKAGRLTLTNGARITSGTTGLGQGGTVAIIATDTLAIDRSTVSVSSTDGGRAGDIRVQAGRLTLTGGAQISSSTSGPGQGGTITVTATDTVAISGRNSGLSTSTMGLGLGGEIALQARQIQLTDGALIAAESTGTGNAGSLTLTARDILLLRGHSAVTTAASEATGGNIQITASSLVRVQNSQITATVGGGTGDGGNVTIDPEFIVLQGSQITANAVAGHGGRIDLTASKVFLADPSSVITASSTLGIQGTVAIQAPVTSISGAVAPLPQAFAQTAELLRSRCAERLREGTVSRFIVGSRDGVPLEPGSLLLSPLQRVDQEAAVQDGQRQPQHPEPPHAWVASAQVQARGAWAVECARRVEKPGTRGTPKRSR